MASFRGSFKFTLDHKGRISIPVKFRNPDSSTSYHTFIVTRGLEDCLFLYPLDEWEKVESNIRTLSFTQGNNRLFSRMFMETVNEVQVDNQGRILIPQSLLSLAKISKEILIIGIFERIELWNPEEYQKYKETNEKAGSTFEAVAEQIYLNKS
jgi:MraZ protein